jgi:hypothetical protein
MTTFKTVINNVSTTLDSGITDSATSLTVASGEGAQFGSTFPLHITIGAEIIEVGGRSVDTLNTLVRAREGTSASAHSTGTAVRMNITAGHVSDLNTAVNTAEVDIATNATDIATNVTDIATNATGIATNATDIGSRLVAASNLSDLASTATARANLGVDDSGAATGVLLDATPGSDHSVNGVVGDEMNAGSTFSFGQVAYMASDGELTLADADAEATMPVIAMAAESGSDASPNDWLFVGFARDDTWNWTVGGTIYASTTPGGLTQTAPTGSGDIVQVLGVATHADRIWFNPSLDTLEHA